MSLTIISWNVNGIRAVIKKGFHDFLSTHKPDILGLQEVKISDTVRDREQFDFPAYTEYWNSALRPGYSGTMTLVTEKKKKGLEFVAHTTGVKHEAFDYEGRVQTLEFEKFFLINAYFPNARDDLSRLDFKSEFNKLMLKHIKKCEKKKPVIVMGDYNVAHEVIDLARPKPNTGKKGFTVEERADMDTFIKHGFVDTFRLKHPTKIQYSWWSQMGGARARNVGWRIDYILVSASLAPKVTRAFISDNIMGSDHCPVGITINV